MSGVIASGIEIDGVGKYLHPLTETEKSKTLACINAEQRAGVETTEDGHWLLEEHSIDYYYQERQSTWQKAQQDSCKWRLPIVCTTDSVLDDDDLALLRKEEQCSTRDIERGVATSNQSM